VVFVCTCDHDPMRRERTCDTPPRLVLGTYP
jgi:hypothetical protein